MGKKECQDLRKELGRVEEELKAEQEEKTTLQHKVDEMSRAAQTASTSSDVPPQPRNAANIRPMPPNRVRQVTPIKVTPRQTRMARVIPEQREAADDTVQHQSVMSGSASQQVASSSTHTSAVSVPTGTVVASPSFSTSVPSVLVHPMNPARSGGGNQQQQVVSSGTGPIAVVSHTTSQQMDVSRP